MPTSLARRVTVRVPAKQTLPQAEATLRNVLGHLGCPMCLSGFNINFTDEVTLQIDAATQAVREI
jgi:hypothetical protein